ncbi:TonB-dependent receptor domain-containing protein [Eilatimonas milleporae]|uniref:Iron complex outermembrane receptor protein n=1 Tax=Eilatimonas milleporae TaxID=911205 RepID=A0A3M0CQ72_9PROT|nr:TonB-dependent receptor [Eilatimonas milleporae]RMB11728.1 iron complex outermembrane receptor protein [Eilatimonas milleporae]
MQLTAVRLATLLGGISLPVVASHAAISQNEGAEDTHVEEIIVSSRPFQEQSTDVAQAISIVADEALDRLRTRTLGETLDSLPGISQTYFGPAVSRPIIRGLGGDRIRVLIGGIGSIDASSTSVDHAVAIDPETADKIEILRGPATLLFGNNAVGGAVNVFDGRIPSTAPEDGFEGRLHAHYGTNGDELNGSAGFTAMVTDTIAFHADFNALDRGDLEIPGFAESDALRALEDDHDHDHDDHDDDHGHDEEHGDEEMEGTVENTDLRRLSGAGGFSWIGENGFLGFSVSFFDTEYGLPGHDHDHGHDEEGEDHDDDHDEDHGHDHEGEEEVMIDLEQIRFDLMGEFRGDFGIFEKTKIRFGYADYEHSELEGGEIGTTFTNEGWEGRIEMVQKTYGGLNGAIGVQVRNRDFSALGEEAFVPPNDTTQYGVFALETYETGMWRFEAGARLELQDISSDELAFDESYTGISLSAATIARLGNGWQVAVNGYRTERAPNAEELLSNGPHLATGLFELGDPTLEEETALGFDIRLAKTEGPVTGSVSFFYTDYEDFIFQNLTGEEDDDLPIAAFQATDARFWGVEVEMGWRTWQDGDRSFDVTATADWVRAEDTDNDLDLPRIPPLSATVGGIFQSRLIDAHVELTYTDEQDRVAPFELITDDFFALAAGITVHPMGPNGPLHLFAEGRNLLDEEIRFHTSFLKDQVPAPGLDVRFGARYTF